MANKEVAKSFCTDETNLEIKYERLFALLDNLLVTLSEEEQLNLNLPIKKIEKDSAFNRNWLVFSRSGSSKLHMPK